MKKKMYQFSCLKKYFKIPPNLPFPKGGETLPPLKKGGLRGIFEVLFSGRLVLFKQLMCYEFLQKE
jgi:hypothetical protein